MARKLIVMIVSLMAIYGSSLEIKGSPLSRLEQNELEQDAPAEYIFSYSVNDPKTGDIKSQKESRKDDKVEGSYELIDSDGFRRIVNYKADDQNGFEAFVQREPTNIKIPVPEQERRIIGGPIKLLAAPILKYAEPRLSERSLSSEPRYENQVSFSAPSVSYKY